MWGERLEARGYNISPLPVRIKALLSILFDVTSTIMIALMFAWMLFIAE